MDMSILPETDKREAMELADRLREKIANHTVEFGKERICLTASFGVAELDHECSEMAHFIQEADDMLYKAKLKGRNLVMPGLMKLFSMQTSQEQFEGCV